MTTPEVPTDQYLPVESVGFGISPTSNLNVQSSMSKKNRRWMIVAQERE